MLPLGLNMWIKKYVGGVRSIYLYIRFKYYTNAVWLGLRHLYNALKKCKALKREEMRKYKTASIKSKLKIDEATYRVS